MRNSNLIINSNAVIPLDRVKYISKIDEYERERLVGRLKFDISCFHTRIKLVAGSPQLARDCIDDLNEQVGLVDLGNNRFVPAVNIILARRFGIEQAEKLKGRGYQLSVSYRSSIETCAGIILSTAEPQQIMERRSSVLVARRRPAGRQTTSNTDLWGGKLAE